MTAASGTRRLTSRGVGRSPRPSRALLAAAVVVAAWSALPIAFVVVAWVGSAGSLEALLFRPRVVELLLGTAGLVLVATPTAAVLGVSAAWIVERTAIPGRRLLAVLFALPLAIPAFVNSFAWIATVPSLSGLGAGVLITCLSYYPLIYLPVAAALRRLDPGLEEGAAALGKGPWTVARTVVLPQLRLPILGGALLVGLHLLSEYGAFAMIRFDTFTTAIMAQYRASFGGPAASVLAGVLVLCCLLLVGVESALRGRMRFARVGSGVARPPHLVDRTPVVAAGALFSIVLLGLALGVPVIALGRWAIAGGAAAWTEAWLLPALAGSVGLGLAAAVACAVAALPVAILAVRFPSAVSRVLEGAIYLGSSLPGIAIALAVVTVAVTFLRPLYQTLPVLVGAYLLLFLPRALVSQRAGLAQVPPGLEEAARSLGRSPLSAFLTVTARLVTPAAVAGASLVFLGVVNELTATLLLAPNGTRTLAMQFWTHTNDLDYGSAAPYAILMVLISLPITLVLFRSVRRAVSR